MGVRGFTNIDEAVRHLDRYVQFKLRQTTLKVENSALATDERYYMHYRSDLGCVMYRLISNGSVKWYNPYELYGLRKITAHLITEHCQTKYNKPVDGRVTLAIFAKEEPEWV